MLVQRHGRLSASQVVRRRHPGAVLVRLPDSDAMCAATHLELHYTSMLRS